jgi:hypothetical protein
MIIFNTCKCCGFIISITGCEKLFPYEFDELYRQGRTKDIESGLCQDCEDENLIYGGDSDEWD